MIDLVFFKTPKIKYCCIFEYLCLMLILQINLFFYLRSRAESAKRNNQSDSVSAPKQLIWLLFWLKKCSSLHYTSSLKLISNHSGNLWDEPIAKDTASLYFSRDCSFKKMVCLLITLNFDSIGIINSLWRPLIIINMQDSSEEDPRVNQQQEM